MKQHKYEIDSAHSLGMGYEKIIDEWEKELDNLYKMKAPEIETEPLAKKIEILKTKHIK